VSSANSASGAAVALPKLPKEPLATDADFIANFESRKLTGWNHLFYLRVIYVYLKQLGRREGVKKAMAELEKFQKEGYHLTLTYFWIQMVDLAIATESQQTSFSDLIEANRDLKNEDLWLRYYSKQIIDGKAQSEMVLPDKQPLPSLVIKK